MVVSETRQQLVNEAQLLRREIGEYDEWAPAWGRRRLAQLDERLARIERKLKDESI